MLLTMSSMQGGSQPATLRNAQVSALLSMLNLNKPTNPAKPAPTSISESNALNIPSGPPAWKVLVMDKVSQDILATSLRVQDLRDNGVTLHMQLMGDRPPLPDVPAVYFVSPSRENLTRIAKVSGEKQVTHFVRWY